jgi:hypothetical protein
MDGSIFAKGKIVATKEMYVEKFKSHHFQIQQANVKPDRNHLW